MTTTAQFNGDTANWLIKQGLAERIAAKDLNDSHVGRGLFHELWRDHEWLYIDSVVHKDGQVEVSWLIPGQSKNVGDTTKDGVRTQVSENKFTREKATFNAADGILLDLGRAPTRPKNTRSTKVTCLFHEELDEAGQVTNMYVDGASNPAGDSSASN